jgi:hypothetical protein
MSLNQKRFKWDSKAVISAVGRVKAEAFRYTGLDIMRTAKRSMKKPKKNGQKHSSPGSPPFVHTGALRNSINFAWDSHAKSVVAGPVPFKGRSAGARALEFGGTVKTKIVTQTTVDRRQERGTERGYFAGSPSRISRDKKKRGLPPIPSGQEKHIREYYEGGEKYEKAVKVTKTVKIKARPAMNPAMKKELQKLPERLKRAAKKFK